MQNDPYKNAVKYFDKLWKNPTAETRKIGLEMYPPEKGMRILDVGCGTGLSLQHYQPYECEIYGIDLSPSMIAAAKDKFGDEADLRLGDASKMPYPDDYFDLVVTMLTLHEMEPEIRSRTFSEMLRVNKPNGRLLLTDFHYGKAESPIDLAYKAFRFFGEMSSGRDHFRNFRNFIANRGLRFLIESNGLHIRKEYIRKCIVVICLVSQTAQ